MRQEFAVTQGHRAMHPLHMNKEQHRRDWSVTPTHAHCALQTLAMRPFYYFAVVSAALRCIFSSTITKSNQAKVCLDGSTLYLDVAAVD